MTIARRGKAAVVLEDGRIFRGDSFGAQTDAEGEIVFTTTMTGYQEVATDPSFFGQIVTMTYPLIGNYGVTAVDDQSRRPWIRGMIVREYVDTPSNWNSEGDFAAYLIQHNIPAITGVDTRALTRHIRHKGDMRGLICSDTGSRSDEELRQRARSAWSPADENVVRSVTVEEQLSDCRTDQLHVVLIDCGVKQHIVESLERRGVCVTVVPFDTQYADIAALRPDGILTSPGPGDPENAEIVVSAIHQIIENQQPYFGVCLGHQLLALAIGASTSKLKFGHRGGNHPVLDLDTGRIYITAQNHGYQIESASVPVSAGWRVSKISLNDGSAEGLSHATLPIFSVQYHPEGSPGPQDSQYLFDEFLDLIRATKSNHKETDGE
jgi:carbamoyl-phosphate synthase small subunit